MEKEYSKHITRIAAIMLMHFCLWFMLSTVYSVICNTFFLGLSPVAYEVACDLLYMAVYVVFFGLPILTAKRFMKGTLEYDLSNKISGDAVPAIILSVALIYGASIFGSVVTAPLDALGFDVFDADVGMTVTPVTVLVKLFMMVIIPAILEETLFRGVIMRSLIPYGKTQAIMLSALLFATMHQNPKQFIYALAGGIVIGYFVAERGSLLLGMLIHGINNLLSLVTLVVYNTCSEKVYTAFCTAFFTFVFCGALVAVPVLLYGSKRKEQSREETPRLFDFSFMHSPLMLVYFIFSILYVFYILVMTGAGR